MVLVVAVPDTSVTVGTVSNAASFLTKQIQLV